jgi:DNA-directed RNA polymerase subunit RPC12/RpoP
MTITEKSAYIKGLAEGLALDESKPESKVILKLLDLVNDIALSVSDIEAEVEDIENRVDEIDEDLGEVEDIIYDDDDDDDCDCDCDCSDSDDMFVVKCPSCGEKVYLDESLLLDGEIDCPGCGEKLEFDFDDDTAEDEAVSE